MLDAVLYSFALAGSIAIVMGTAFGNFLRKRFGDGEEAKQEDSVSVGPWTLFLAPLLRFSAIFAKALAYGLGVFWTFQLFMPIGFAFLISVLAFASTLVCAFAIANDDILEFSLSHYLMRISWKPEGPRIEQSSTKKLLSGAF